MTNPNPLDIAAQITLISWTLDEYPEARSPSEALLSRALQLSGIRDIRSLKLRKAQGQSVFGQTPSYSRGTLQERDKLIQQVDAVLAGLPDSIAAPTGKPIVPGPTNEVIVADGAIGLAIDDVYYEAPLQNAP